MINNLSTERVFSNFLVNFGTDSFVIMPIHPSQFVLSRQHLGAGILPFRG